MSRANPDRLYELLPVVHRLRDADRGYPLRALLKVIAEQVDVVDTDIAQLYENWFVETCQDWVVPYIGDLVGYTPQFDVGEPGGVLDARAQAPRADPHPAPRGRQPRPPSPPEGNAGGPRGFGEGGCRLAGTRGRVLSVARSQPEHQLPADAARAHGRSPRRRSARRSRQRFRRDRTQRRRARYPGAAFSRVLQHPERGSVCLASEDLLGHRGSRVLRGTGEPELFRVQRAGERHAALQSEPAPVRRILPESSIFPLRSRDGSSNASRFASRRAQ